MRIRVGRGKKDSWHSMYEAFDMAMFSAENGL